MHLKEGTVQNRAVLFHIPVIITFKLGYKSNKYFRSF